MHVELMLPLVLALVRARAPPCCRHTWRMKPLSGTLIPAYANIDHIQHQRFLSRHSKSVRAADAAHAPCLHQARKLCHDLTEASRPHGSSRPRCRHKRASVLSPGSQRHGNLDARAWQSSGSWPQQHSNSNNSQNWQGGLPMEGTPGLSSGASGAPGKRGSSRVTGPGSSACSRPVGRCLQSAYCPTCSASATQMASGRLAGRPLI